MGALSTGSAPANNGIQPSRITAHFSSKALRAADTGRFAAIVADENRMFAIEFIGNPQIEFGEWAARGRMTLGEFSEEFVAPLTFWTVDDYRRQWREAARRLVDGCERACFVAAMRESPLDGAIFLWSAWRDGEVVYIQHKLVLPELDKGSFETSNPCGEVEERQILSDEGESVSEWQVALEDIARFLRAA